MRVQFNQTQKTKAELAHALGEILGVKPKYLRAPSFAHKIGDFTVDRDGGLSFGAAGPSEAEARGLLNQLAERGFSFMELEGAGGESEEPASAAKEPEDPADPEGEAMELSVQVPLAGFDETALRNLEKLVAGHATLLKKATGAESLPIKRDGDESLVFPWFSPASAADIAPCTQLVFAMCEMAKKQKRVLVTDKPYENEKYAFRRFLLRLGFIGPEYAPARKCLLAKFQGNAAFKSGGKKTTEMPAD